MHMQYKVDPADALALPSFRSLYWLTAAVGLLVGADLICWWLGFETLRNPGGINLSLIAAVLGGARIVYGAVASLLEGDVGADLALALALLAALLLKEYWVGAEVVLIALVGESLEALTFARTHRELERIMELRPRSIRVRRGGHELELPVDEVVVGDTVIVRPGERIPVDGVVLTGRSTIDQSTLTGESLPVDRGEGDSVFAGTLNQFGALALRAEVVGEHTTLGQVIQLVAEAQQHKARVERTADRLARYFLPFVLACAAATFVFTNLTAITALRFGGFESWVWMPTLSVLVVACPCALILATPAAMMAAFAWLARRGVLVKGGAALEQLASVTRVAFDKTGTLTTGELQLGDCVALGEFAPQDVLRLAATAEQSSEHLIASAIVRAAREQQLAVGQISDFEALPGTGVAASTAEDGSPPRKLLVGNRRLLQEHGIEITSETDRAVQQLEASVQTPLLVCADGRVVGLIGLRDTVRPEAAQVIRELRALGIDEIALLTGDRRAAAARIAAEVGIDQLEAELLPREKAQWLAAWRHSEGPHPNPLPKGEGTRSSPSPGTPGEGWGERPPGTPGEGRGEGRRRSRSIPLHHVAMIGDGINDAPALASADVGLALAGIGSDLAAEAGDLVLMGGPLTPLPSVLRLARETVRVIRQNILLFAFFVNFLGIVLTAWIMPTWSETWLRRSPVAAALFHQIGSVLVLLNAMRLLWFERWQSSIFGRIENALAAASGRFLEGLMPIASFAGATWRRRWRLAGAAAFISILAYLALGIVIVQPDEVAVAQRFGRYEGALSPGLHLRLPPPWDTIVKDQPARVRTIEIGLRTATPDPGSAGPAAIEWNSPHQEGAFERRADEAIILTGDQSLVEVGATVQFHVRDLRAFRFTVREPERVLASLAEGVIREILATEPLLASSDAQPNAREILTTARGDLEERIRVELQARANSLQLGVEVLPHGVCLQDVHPPLEVVGAFRDVSMAFKEKERMRNEADALYRDKVIKAGGEAAWRQLAGGDAALSDAVWEQLQGQIAGEAAAELFSAQAFASQQQELAAGHAASFVLQEAAHARSPQLTAWRLFLDTLAAAMSGKKKLILDHEGAGRRHLFLGVPQSGANAMQPLMGLPGPLDPEADE